ncbi:MAG: hypothetical protein IKL68_01605 [Clostridia bacterium]|nr:hypothetical protein [Clostridia bacterium]
MFRKIRRRLAHRHIKKFLEEFIPCIGLGEVHLFCCENFRLGQYAVHTTKGKYKLTFWELCNGAKEFTLWLNYKQGEGEFITFSIIGNISFAIMPETHTMDKKGERQVVDLINGAAKVYPKENKSDNVNYKMIEYKQYVMKSDVIDIENLIKETYNYIF